MNDAVRTAEAILHAACGDRVRTAFALAPLLDALLYDVAPRDFATFAAVTLALAVASTLTSWSAAARAGSVDPMKVLRGL